MTTELCQRCKRRVRSAEQVEALAYREAERFVAIARKASGSTFLRLIDLGGGWRFDLLSCNRIALTCGGTVMVEMPAERLEAVSLVAIGVRARGAAIVAAALDLDDADREYRIAHAQDTGADLDELGRVSERRRVAALALDDAIRAHREALPYA